MTALSTGDFTKSPLGVQALFPVFSPWLWPMTLNEE
jgi:hypothetical protein